MHHLRTALALAIALSLSSATARGATSATATASAAAAAAPSYPPAGHTRSISPEWTIDPPIIDGDADDAVWGDAPVADNFWVSESERWPSEWTEVRILYDETTLYLAFTCYDSVPAAIQSQQTIRNAGPRTDDRVVVEIDGYHNHRLVSRFSVNAGGTQFDAIAGGRAGKIEWRGDWRAAAQRTAFGWTAEIAIPLRILEFDSRTSTFGMNFVRYHSRTQEWSYWADVTPLNLREEAGHLTDMSLEPRPASGRLTAMQYASAGLNTTNERNEFTTSTARTGLDVRYDGRGNMTTLVSVNPDFSQTDSDVLGLSFDYNEKFRSDHRPFFQEGAAFFGDRSDFHSGRIGDVDLGVKSFGRVGAFQIGALGVTSNSEERRDYVTRVVREFGPTVNAGMTLVGTDRPGSKNQLAKAHAGGRLGKHFSFDTAVAQTWSRGIEDGDGGRVTAALEYGTDGWYGGAGADRTDPGYLHEDGFIGGDVPGTMGGEAHAGYTRRFGASWLERADVSVALDHRKTSTGQLQRESLSLYGGAETRSHLQLSGGMTAGPYRPRGAGAHEWRDTLYDDRFYVISAYHSGLQGRLGYGMTWNWGFLGGSDYANLAPSIKIAPSSRVSLSYSYERAEYGETQQQNVVSATWDMTAEQGLSVRWVEYDGGYYRFAYRRVVKRGVDVFAVYSDDPYMPESMNVKLVWTLVPLHLR